MLSITSIKLIFQIAYFNKIQQQQTQMNMNIDLTVDSIIKKYQKRQEQLSYTLQQSSNINKTNSLQHQKSGLQTPEFSDTSRKEKQPFINPHIEKTQKKNQSYESFNPKEILNSSFNSQNLQKRQYESLLIKLDQTEQKLIRSEKNYAEMWRKYQKLQKDHQKHQKSVQIQQKLRGKDSNQLQIRIASFDKEINSLKQCLNAKDGNIAALKDKLQQKSEKLIQTERNLQVIKSEAQMLRAKNQTAKQEQDYKKQEKETLLDTLKKEISKYEGIIIQKQKEKKELLVQIQKNYHLHKEELQILRLSYEKVEEEYKEWIEKCNQQKLSIIQQYQTKLKESSKNSSINHFKSTSLQILEEELIQKTKEINQLISANLILGNQLKLSKLQNQKYEKIKCDLIGKVSNLQNNMIQKVQYQKNLENSYTKLQNVLKNQQQKNKQLTTKYNNMNKQFHQLKNKCSVIFSQIEEKKQVKDNQSLEIIRLKKQIMICKEQLERTKNNELSLTSKLNESLNILKDKKVKFDQQKEEIMTDLLAQRLSNAKLKQELKQTKQYLQKQYQLSLENLKTELQSQIKSNTYKPGEFSNYDVEKEQLYLQLRELQRRYQLLASEVVTVDQMIGLANKVHRRHQSKK